MHNQKMRLTVYSHIWLTLVGRVVALLIIFMGSVGAVQDGHAEEPLLEQVTQEIRNGSQQTTHVLIGRGNLRAIGWFFKGVNPNSPSARFCTGTVISPYSILTAKHCFRQNPSDPNDKSIFLAPPPDYQFAVPTEDSVDDGRFDASDSFPLSQATLFHSEDYDITIVRFSSPVFNLTGLLPIPVNNQPIEGDLAVNLMNSTVQVAGYGETWHEGELGLHFAAVKVDLITHEFIMVNGESQQGLCNGDSGGPLIAAGVDGGIAIYSVVRGGDECCIGIDQTTRIDLEINLLISAGAATPIPDFPEACWGISERNRCEGDFLYTCDLGQPITLRCPVGTSCGYVLNDDRFLCAPSETAGCIGIPPEGICAGPTELIRCENGKEKRISCIAAECGSFVEGGRKACLGYGSPSAESCDEKNIARVYNASQAKFGTASQCALFTRRAERLPLDLLLSLIAMLFPLLLLRRRWKRNALSGGE